MLYVAPLTLRSGLRQQGKVSSAALPRPYASALVSSGNHAPRQRTGLDCVAPSALCAWATLKNMEDCGGEEFQRRIPAIEVVHVWPVGRTYKGAWLADSI